MLCKNQNYRYLCAVIFPLVFASMVERLASALRSPFRLCLLPVLLLPIWAPAQDASNPFELRYRLPKEALLAGEANLDSINPFEVGPHRPPGVSKALVENETAPFNPFSILPRGGGLHEVFLFSVLLLIFGFLVFSIAANRNVVGKAWRSFLNDNALAQVQREAFGLVGSTPYYLLYASFILNAGLLIFLVTRVFKGELFNNWMFLLVCILGAGAIFISKHLMLKTIGWLFPVKSEMDRYNFLMIIFNCVLGLFLMPFNFLLIYAPAAYRLLVLFWILGLIGIFYLYRGARAGQIGLKFLGTDQFHFLLYLCTVEIAPVLFLVKLAMIQTT